MTTEDRRARAAYLVLRLAVLAWLGLAVWQAARVVQLEDMGFLRQPGASRAALLALLPLAAAWCVVLGLSLRAATSRLLAGVLAQGLSVGPIALTAMHLIGVTRAGGPAFGSMGLMLASLVPQALALAAAARGRRALHTAAPPLGRARAFVAWCVAAVASFLLNATALGASSMCQFTEARAIGDLRTLLSAEDTYQSANSGSFGSLQCLVTPRPCLARYPAEAPVFLDATLLHPVRCGYRFAFHPGRPVAPAVAGAPGPGTDSVASFTVTAVPVVPGHTGARAFCADSDGVIWESADGRLPLPAGARCPEGMAPLR